MACSGWPFCAGGGIGALGGLLPWQDYSVALALTHHLPTLLPKEKSSEEKGEGLDGCPRGISSRRRTIPRDRVSHEV
ncbi:unnamed protein product [Prunus armeniaca]